MSSVKIAILDDYQGVALTSADWSPLQNRGTQIDVYRDTLLDEDALVERLKDYEVICAMRERTKFFKPLLDRLPKLRLIATTGPRNLGIDSVYAKTKGVIVSGTGFRGRDTTIEHIWALLLATVRHIAVEDANVKARKAQWQSTIPLALTGRTLGLVGVGRLGTHVAKIAKLFDLKVIGWSPNLTPARAEASGVEYVATKAELFSRSDIVSIHIVLSESTQGLITQADFDAMKPTAFFINTSRGPIVDEKALIDTLKAGKIAGAGLDVFDIEPLPLDHLLRTTPRVTFSPHTGYVSDSTYENWYNITVENILNFLDGSPSNVI